ncbi:Bug family tripartite tricarboxylate transporter substrate binding protein [Ramlibacter sp.]|uniref:Bug family tripartite tricarboxylate transporter substrate binding protein n=1 Tax=Ramlibacter sp. TaxID=1917967 RepID=UPI003D0C542A
MHFQMKSVAGRLSSLILVLCLAPVGAQAQGAAFPGKAMDITVPFTPGGGVDLLARMIAQPLSAATGQSVVVENRPGASGAIGARYIAGRPADGHSMLMMNDTYAITAATSKSPAFDAKKDIAPVIVVAYAPQLLVTAPQSPLNSFADIVKAGKAPNSKVSYGACGAGTPGHLAAESLNLQYNMKILHIPYKGCGPTLVDVMGGQVDLAWVTLGAAVPHIKAGKLKPLAVSSAQRSAVLPDVPTLVESGVPGFNFSSWQGIGVPGGTPENVRRQLHAAIANVVKAEAFQKRLVELGYTPANLNEPPSTFQATVASDIDRFAQIGKQINFTLE